MISAMSLFSRLPHDRRRQPEVQHLHRRQVELRQRADEQDGTVRSRRLSGWKTNKQTNNRTNKQTNLRSRESQKSGLNQSKQTNE